MAAKNEIPPDKLACYDRLVETIPNLERKGVTLPYTSLNGHMFSFLAQDGSLAIRLPKGAREDFLEKYQTTLREANGIVMKEYVSIPGELLENTQELKEYFEQSYAYVKALKPKPQKKKK